MFEKAMNDMMQASGMSKVEDAITGSWIKNLQTMTDQMTAMSERMLADMGKAGIEPAMFNAFDPMTMIDKMPKIDQEMFEAPEQFMFNPMAMGAQMLTAGIAMQQAMMASSMQMMSGHQG